MAACLAPPTDPWEDEGHQNWGLPGGASSAQGAYFGGKGGDIQGASGEGASCCPEDWGPFLAAWGPWVPSGGCRAPVGTFVHASDPDSSWGQSPVGASLAAFAHKALEETFPLAEACRLGSALV